MFSKLFRLSRTDGKGSVSPLADGFHKGQVLSLPLGSIVAEQGVRHLHGPAPGRSVEPVLDEAYVVIRLYDQTCWYATWEPYGAGWSLLRLDSDDTEPAANDADYPHSPRAHDGRA
jgi:hypothetical protein